MSFINDNLEHIETYMPDGLEPLLRLRKQLDIAIQCAESGQLVKLSPEELLERQKHPEILGEIGDFEIRWRNQRGKELKQDIKEWRETAVRAMAELLAQHPEYAYQVLMHKFNS